MREQQRHLAVVKEPPGDASDEEPLDAALARGAGADQRCADVLSDPEDALGRFSGDQVGLDRLRVDREELLGLGLKHLLEP